MQQTLILLKPDCVQNAVCGKVITRFEDAGYQINACKMMQLTPEILRDHYSHIAAKPFYPEVEEFMMSSPVIALVLAGENIVEDMREMLGVTNSLEAAPGTIRAEWGNKDPQLGIMLNVCHASDGVDAAAEEITRFFPEGTVR